MFSKDKKGMSKIAILQMGKLGGIQRQLACESKHLGSGPLLFFGCVTLGKSQAYHWASVSPSE